MDLREGAVVADRFRLVRLLGQGGMGEVWAARHISLDIPCAVKFIHAESAEKPEVRERFEREARAAAQLRSPHVVHILDYGVFESTPYIAMEYLEGEPLSARLKRCGRLDAHQTFRIVAGVAKALTKAHAAGIVHRDLKPENVFLVPDEEGEIAKVLDFGVAKRTTTLDSNTRTGALLGTPFFMSPEQAQGTKTVDHRADLWSLGVVTYRCITGELPFNSHALGDLLIKIVTHPLPIPSHVCPGLPEAFDAWWARAAQREPAYRYQSAKDLVEALGLALCVSVPSVLANTPMPGTTASPVALALPQASVTAAGAQYATGPALPWGASQPAGQSADPRAYGAAPAAAYAAQGGGMSGYAAQGSGPPGYALAAGGFPTPDPAALGDSGASASVAGLSTATAGSSNGRKVALAGIAVAVLAVGAVGAFLVVRGVGRGPAEASSTSPSQATGTTLATSTGPTASSRPGGTGGGDAATSSVAGSQGGAPPATTSSPTAASSSTLALPPTSSSTAPVAPPPTTPSTTPRVPPTTLDVPTKPPRTASTYDPGF